MADAMDSKSIVRKDVWVRLPPPVSSSLAITCGGFFLLVSRLFVFKTLQNLVYKTIKKETTGSAHGLVI